MGCAERHFQTALKIIFESKKMKKFYIETYGCQMNIADSQVVASELVNSGYELTNDYKDADIIMVNTCSVRDNAEQRVLGRLGLFHGIKKYKKDLKIGVLGCMAQRLQDKLLEENKSVDFVAGPDSYRHISDLISRAETGERPLDTVLSKKETYEDISPLRFNDKNNVTTFVSISRGCDNMCTFCIVPFTRGRERSRSPETILREIQQAVDEGYKEVTLLGQNVDKYNWNNNELDFAGLLELVAVNFPKTRIRFATSYPQHMKDEVLHVIAKHNNVCKYIHLPVQSGSNAVLKTMKRGYTREWYLDRIKAIREIVPDAAISTDIIAGFCGETEEDHLQTIDLMKTVGFDYAYMFKYSERPNTYAAKRLKDDVPEEVKSRRLTEIIDVQNRLSYESNKRDVGKTFEVLVEGYTKKSKKQVFGRNSQNKVIIFDGTEDLIGQLVDVTVHDFTQATLFGKMVNI